MRRTFKRIKTGSPFVLAALLIIPFVQGSSYDNILDLCHQGGWYSYQCGNGNSAGTCDTDGFIINRTFGSTYSNVDYTWLSCIWTQTILDCQGNWHEPEEASQTVFTHYANNSCT